MRSFAERIEDRVDVGVKIVGLHSHIECGDYDVIGERSVAVAADRTRVQYNTTDDCSVR